MFTKITTESQAKEFVESVENEFPTIGHLTDWLKRYSDDIGVVKQEQFTIPVFDKNNPTEMEERHCLMLNFGENKTIIFVGNEYENSCRNFIYSTIDFSAKQYHANTFIYVQTTKNKQYLEALESGNMNKAKETYKEIGTIAAAFL